jgi:hypothetical protein
LQKRAIAFAIEQPPDVDVNEIVVRPTQRGRDEQFPQLAQSGRWLLTTDKNGSQSKRASAQSGGLDMEHTPSCSLRFEPRWVLSPVTS